MSKAEKALYGKVAIFRMECPDCGFTSLVIDGRSACCEAKLHMPKEYQVRRYASGDSFRKKFPIKIRRAVLEEQGYICFYCGVAFGESYWSPRSDALAQAQPGFDHFIPWIYCRSSTADNVVAACQTCNSIKSDLVFENRGEAIRFVRDRREAKGYERCYVRDEDGL